MHAVTKLLPAVLDPGNNHGNVGPWDSLVQGLYLPLAHFGKITSTDKLLHASFFLRETELMLHTPQ